LWRQTVRKLIYKAKTHYCNTHINENKRNPEQLWNSFRELSGTSVSSTIPHLNDVEGNLITTSKTADMFNTHFCNIYRYISSNSTNSPDFTTLAEINSKKLEHVHKTTIPQFSL